MKRKEELKYQTKTGRKVKRYATKERMAKINPKNIREYDRYLKSSKIKNSDVKDTTYKVYQSYMNIFMCFIAEREDNFYLLDEEFLEDNMLDVMEDYIEFLQNECGNGKKVINTKLSAVSSFYIWAVKRGKLKAHPFDGKLDRIKNAQEEKRISVYFLNDDEVKQITETLAKEKTSLSKYDWQDEVMWNIAFDSACRIGALHNLNISNINWEKRVFTDVREKRGKIVDIPFTEYTKEIIERYLKWREENGIDTDALFYVWKQGKWDRMSTQSMTIRIRKIGEIIGVGDFRPHCIRKTRLNQVGKNNIQLAKELAHHESMDTTARFYMEKKSESETLAEINKIM